MTNTKLVATIGPACDSDETLGAMIDAGVNVFRLNFSHGTLDAHGNALERVRRLATERGAIVAVMGDLCGPKIRVGRVAGGSCTLADGSQVIFQRDPVEGTPQRLSSNYPALIDDAEVGHRLLIDDGNILLRVTEKRQDELVCTCEVGGIVSDRKGINLPDSDVSTPAITEKDRTDLEWAIGHGVDFVALSFVRRPDDLAALRRILDEHDNRIRIVAKIEKPEAIVHLEAIVHQADVILVARGDLGVEMDVSRVPILQKEITLMSRWAGKPVIVATQMLQSMVTSPVPTRAEVSDVANAILDGADAVMLSAETSVGQNPLRAVHMIRRIAEQTESFGVRYRDELGTNQAVAPGITTAVVRGASVVASELNTSLVAVWTERGNTPRLLSRYRLAQPIVALAPCDQVCRQMTVLYGVVPVCLKPHDRLETMLADLDAMLLQRNLAAAGDQIIVVADSRPDLPGETDILLIHPVGSSQAATPPPLTNNTDA